MSKRREIKRLSHIASVVALLMICLAGGGNAQADDGYAVTWSVIGDGVNFNSPPNVPEVGDFGAPFKSMAAAQGGVAEGGTVKIMPGKKTEVIRLSKAMKIRAVPGPAGLSTP